MIKDHAYGGLYKQSLGKKDHNLNVWSEMNVHTFFDFSIKYFFLSEITHGAQKSSKFPKLRQIGSPYCQE